MLAFCAYALLCSLLFVAYLQNSIKEKQITQTTQTAIIEQMLNQQIAEERKCLVNALYYEARSESNLGILAVASVIENRKNSQVYPSTYCKVVNQYKQFSFTLEDKPDVEMISNTLTAYDKKSYEYISELSDTMVMGSFETILPKNVMWYHTKKIKPYWTKSKNIYDTIGAHHFYKQKEKPNAKK